MQFRSGITVLLHMQWPVYINYLDAGIAGIEVDYALLSVHTHLLIAP